MNELQQTEFELLKEFDRVCAELKLPYFLVCGTALGAVKYSGFIPWDDDIDVAMYREDYERFCREAPPLLPGHLFLQNFRSDPAFPQIFSKLRNSNTAYIEKTAAKLPINHGVFLDIFPLDGYPMGRIAQKWLELWKRLYGSMLLAAFDVPDAGLQKLWRRLGLTKKTAKTAAALDRLIRRYPAAGSRVICNHGNWQGTLEYAPRWHYGKGIEANFEGLPVRIPEHYHEYLTQKYGDYTQDLPKEQQMGHHGYEILDCEKPYTMYIANQVEKKK